MFVFNKNFGQNFISDEILINKIIDAIKQIYNEKKIDPPTTTLSLSKNSAMMELR